MKCECGAEVTTNFCDGCGRPGPSGAILQLLAYLDTHARAARKRHEYLKGKDGSKKSSSYIGGRKRLAEKWEAWAAGLCC